MDREEFVRRVMDILSELTPEQSEYLLGKLERYLWVMNTLDMWDEKRAHSRIGTVTRARVTEKLWSNLPELSPVTGTIQ